MFRGQRFEVDLDADELQEAPQKDIPTSGVFVGDVLERKTTAPKPPTAPTLTKRDGGFPEHRKRNVESRFKKQSSSIGRRDAQKPTAEGPSNAVKAENSSSAGGKAKTWEEEEKGRIDAENRQKLSAMSTEEIEAERQELMNSLSPALIQRLLLRSNIEDGGAEVDLTKEPSIEPSAPERKSKSTSKSVSFAHPEPEHGGHSSAQTQPNDDLETPVASSLPHNTVHFPRPPQPPDLDPSSPNFLQDLHDKYFPELPSEPEKLSWMSSTSSTNTYSSTSASLAPKDLRFDFTGALLPPRSASEIPVTAGLHHHADAPDSAGYTIPELVMLAQSSFAPQRCVAFQTLGRVLFRLGKGEFGNDGEGREPAVFDGSEADVVGESEAGEGTGFGELARGLWQVVDREQVISILTAASEGKGVDGGRHVSARAYATEAVWLWQKGGGRRWKAE